MRKLNQVNAILTSKKSEVEKQVTEVYKLIQKEVLFQGRERTYRPVDEEKGQRMPPESQKVQQRANDLIVKVASLWNTVWGLTLTQDTGNQSAKADIVVDGKTLLANVPVTTLLYFDKQLNDLETFISKLPVPDPAEEWSTDPNTNLLKGRLTESMRTSKEPTVIVKYEATKEHPAQTEIFTKDIPVGTWSQIQYSGAIQNSRKEELLTKIRKLQEAVKVAREQANLLEVEKQSAKALLDYVFGDVVKE
ncbi:DUF7873 family protein [Zavarzinella formosa]|uniref:DUF7873 family protein n=1 Tax=Zavarzinella formosa TaxID=360055 RepID=UPI0002DEF2E0|nr:hypothetical protein [Zavarzinella formosa]